MTVRLGLGDPQDGSAHDEGPAHVQGRVADHRTPIEFGAVAAAQVGQEQALALSAQLRVATRNVPVEGQASVGDGVVAPDRDLGVERPGLAVKRAGEDFKYEHVCPNRYEGLTKPLPRDDDFLEAMNDRINELLHLIEVEPDALREAEFLQAQAILEEMIGKTVVAAEVEETRIAIATSDGNKYFFYGFLGGVGHSRED
jgi:hypothetical protein